MIKRTLSAIAVTAFILALLTGAMAQTESFTNFLLGSPVGSPTTTDAIPCVESNGSSFQTRQCTPVSLLALLTGAQVRTALGYAPLNPANNLSDVSNTSTAQANLGIVAGTGFNTAGTGLTSTGTTVSLAPSSAGVIGGVRNFTAVAHQWLTALSNGLLTSTQPTFNDISGILAGTGGGTNNAFMQFSGPSGILKTYSLTNTTSTIALLDVADQTLSGGANVTSQGLTSGSIVVDCGSRPLQSINNNGSFTITAPTNDGSCILLINNSGTAGAISFSGFTVGSSTGDAFTTSTTNKFMLTVVRISSTATYLNKALQ